MVGTVFDSIGKRWEKLFHRRYPEMVSRCKDQNGPDFEHPSGFYVETKAGNRLWGVRLKPDQLDYMETLDHPVIYACGMHNMDNALRLVRQETERARQRFLQRNMNIVEVYFVSGEIVRSMFEREQRTSAKEGLVYCMLKPSMLRNVLLDRPFSRFDEKINDSADYYGFDRADYMMGYDGKVGYILNKRDESHAARVLLKQRR